MGPTIAFLEKKKNLKNALVSHLTEKDIKVEGSDVIDPKEK